MIRQPLSQSLKGAAVGLLSVCISACGDNTPALAPDAAQGTSAPSEPAETQVNLVDGCEFWPSVPALGHRAAAEKFGDLILLPTSESTSSDDAFAVWELSGSEWTRRSIDSYFYSTKVVANGDVALLETAQEVYMRTPELVWEPIAGSSGIRGLFRMQDTLYGWRFTDKRRLYRWDQTLGWTYVFATQHNVYSMTASSYGIFVNTKRYPSSQKVLLWNGTELVPFALPTSETDWQVVGDPVGRLFAFAPGLELQHIFLKSAISIS